MKTYLVTGEQRDGEHEHLVHCLVRAESETEFDAKIAEIFKVEDSSPYALDHVDAIFGYGDSSTLTRFKESQVITEPDAAVLERLRICYEAP